MIVHAPIRFYTVLILLDALHPKGVEMAYLDLRAASEEEAKSLAQTFLHPDVKIIAARCNGP